MNKPTDQQMKVALCLAKDALLDANRNGYTRGIEALKAINDILFYTPPTPSAIYHPTTYSGNRPVEKI
jgi:hypothetical protein